jgi:hypothetical protein
MAKAYKAKAKEVLHLSVELDEMASKAGGMAYIAQQMGKKKGLVNVAVKLERELHQKAFSYRYLYISAQNYQDDIRAIDIDKVRNEGDAALKAVGTLFQ